MDVILAQRYAIFHFSNVHDFPNPMLDRDEWENSLLRFMGDDWKVPTKHLLDFHECMHKLDIIHENVLMKMFKYYLEGNAHEWCRSLPIASIFSLIDFHAMFISYCKGNYSTNFLYEGCCEEFDLF